VALELVLAVDCSSSVDWGEFQLQMKGLARAWRHPAVAGALRAAGGEVAVAVLHWSGARSQAVAVDWTLVRDGADAAALATRIEATGRRVQGGATAIATALAVAAREIATNRYAGTRRVIDVSGDGAANQSAAPAAMRDRLIAEGLVVNGLAIRNEEPDVDRYYGEHVVGGPGAFVMDARDYEAFADAMVRKLVREISQAPYAGIMKAPMTAGRPPAVMAARSR